MRVQTSRTQGKQVPLNSKKIPSKGLGLLPVKTLFIRKRPFYFVSGKRKVNLSMTRICCGLAVIHPETGDKGTEIHIWSCNGANNVYKQLRMILKSFGIVQS